MNNNSLVAISTQLKVYDSNYISDTVVLDHPYSAIIVEKPISEITFMQE